MPLNTLENDVLLLERCRRGDRAAYRQIVERYQNLVCSVAYNCCGDFALSEDLSQEAFLSAWEKLADLRDAGRFKAWICSIVRNLANRSARKKLGHSTTDLHQLEHFSEPASTSPSPDAQAASAEEGQLVWQALESIPENYREPIILFYREEQSVARVAESLDLSEDAVKQRLARGRKMLQVELAATIENVLTKSKPTKAFTAVVLASLPAALGTAASAEGATLGAAIKTTGAVFAKAGAGGVTGVPLLTFLAQVPVLSWLIKTAIAEARSPRERALIRRYLKLNALWTLLFFATGLTAIWWIEYLPNKGWVRGMAIPGLMSLAYVPLMMSTRSLNNQLKQLRQEEQTDTPPRPLGGGGGSALSTTGRYTLFGGSVLLVIAWPVGLAVRARDWPVALCIGGASVCIVRVAAWISQRFRKYEFQSFGISNCLVLLLGVAVSYWRHDLWSPEIEDLQWFFAVMMGMGMTVAVLNALVWKAIHGKPRNSV